MMLFISKKMAVSIKRKVLAGHGGTYLLTQYLGG
jgi:hypothetical protein